MSPVRCMCLLFAMCLELGFALESSVKEDGYETFPTVPGSRYKLHTFSQTWTEALSLCQEDGDGSHLVVINSQEEADVVKQMFARITDETIHWLSVGINDIVQEGTWHTIQGGLVSESGYDRWGTGQPDGGPGEPDMDCGTVQRGGTYNDEFCSRPLPFICEKPDV